MWCHCLTKQGCIAGCGLLCAPTAVAMTRVTLHARDLPTRSRGTLRRRRPLTVELRRARSSIHPRARNYGGSRWRRSRSSGHKHKRSFPPLASRVVSAIPRQARRGASGGPPRPRQRDIDRPRPTVGASATTPRALSTSWRERGGRNRWIRRRRADRTIASDSYGEKSARRSATRGELSWQQL